IERCASLARRAASLLLLYEEWNVGLLPVPITHIADGEPLPPVRWLPPPRRGWIRADPFGLRRDGRLFVLYEDYNYWTRRGRISWLASPAVPGQTRGVALALPCHLSFPFLLEHEGDIYCIPESSALREVALYRAVAFPQRWEKAGTLVRGLAAVDSQVIAFAGRWWLFCGISYAEPGSERQLHVYHAPDLHGPWQPHRQNPIPMPAGTARPAGAVFVHDGRLYRCTQDCSLEIAHAVTLTRINRLTPDEFQEEPVRTIAPFTGTRYARRVHHLSAVGDRCLVDGMRYRLIGQAHLRELLGRLISNSVTRRLRGRPGG
ncbi:MAG TPA: hypothetical protein VFA70_15780, partial [Dehalococcoidia bacterium]|nr:hypothetical protein [Dehalococcoidia bacterium]